MIDQPQVRSIPNRVDGGNTWSLGATWYRANYLAIAVKSYLVTVKANCIVELTAYG